MKKKCVFTTFCEKLFWQIQIFCVTLQQKDEVIFTMKNRTHFCLIW
jgi:hypothetical protein